MATSFQGFKSLIENSSDAISLINPQGEILYGSASTTRLTGYQPEELVGRNCLHLIHPEDREQSSQMLREVIAEPPGPRQWESRMLHKDGVYHWVESTVSNLLIESEVRAIVMQQRDINARRAAEEERNRLAEELDRRSSRLEEFAYTAAHDLRQPLRTISLSTERLVRQTETNANAKELAKFIVDSTARMSALVDDLLSWADTGRPDPPQRVDLQRAVAQAVHNLAPDIRASGATVTVDRLPIVMGDEIHLVRLFQNLIGNAVKYRGEDPVQVHVAAGRQGRNWIVSVKDNGCGIAAKNHARIFKPFLRLVGQDVPGSGLGLALCQRIVEGLGGAIWVESELGSGSVFSFTIAPAEAEGLTAGDSHD